MIGDPVSRKSDSGVGPREVKNTPPTTHAHSTPLSCRQSSLSSRVRAIEEHTAECEGTLELKVRSARQGPAVLLCCHEQPRALGAARPQGETRLRLQSFPAGGYRSPASTAAHAPPPAPSKRCSRARPRPFILLLLLLGCCIIRHASDEGAPRHERRPRQQDGRDR